MSNSMEDWTAGSRASSLTRAESLFLPALFSNDSCGERRYDMSSRGRINCKGNTFRAYLEGHVNGVELDLLVQHLDRQLELVECLRDRFELPHGVVDESAPLGAVVELQASRGFIVAEVGGSSESDWQLKGKSGG